jgi:hypothetical protein
VDALALSILALPDADLHDAAASFPLLVATNVSAKAATQLFEADKKTCSLRYDAATRSLYITELPLPRHDLTATCVGDLLTEYSIAQGAAHGTRRAFANAGTTQLNINGNMRMADATASSRWKNVGRFPAVIVEVGASQTIERLDADAQFWLTDPFIVANGGVAGVLILRIFPRRLPPLGQARGSFAAFAAFYEEGYVPPGAAPARTVNQPVGAAVGAPAVGVSAKWAISFGTAPLAAGTVRNQARGLGCPVTGFGFGGPACNAFGLAAYMARIPAAVMYHGVPPANLPPGFPLAGAVAPNANDWVLDTYAFVDWLETATSPAFD